LFDRGKVLQTLSNWRVEYLRRHDSLMKLLDTYHKVHLKDNQHYQDKLSWCLENCQSKFRDIKHEEGIDWYFEIEQDAALFALKWS